MSLELEFKEEELKKIDYMTVTAKHPTGQTQMEGLFLGLQPIVSENTALVGKEDYYLWLLIGDSVRIMDVNDYEIMSITLKLADKNYSDILSCRQITFDQVKKRLKLVQKVFTDEKKVRANGIIDFRKYKNIPSHLKAEEDLQDIMGRGIGHLAPSASPHTHNRSGATHLAHNRRVFVKKTSIIKRSDKLSKSAAEAMRKKLKALKDGKYTPPKLAKIASDDRDNEKDTKKKEKNADTSKKAEASCTHISEEIDDTNVVPGIGGW